MNDSKPEETRTTIKPFGEALLQAIVTNGETNVKELDELLDHILGRIPKPKNHLTFQDGDGKAADTSDNDAGRNRDIALLIEYCDLPRYVLSELNGAPSCRKTNQKKLTQIEEPLSVATIKELSVVDL